MDEIKKGDCFIIEVGYWGSARKGKDYPDWETPVIVTDRTEDQIVFAWGYAPEEGEWTRCFGYQETGLILEKKDGGWQTKGASQTRFKIFSIMRKITPEETQEEVRREWREVPETHREKVAKIFDLSYRKEVVKTEKILLI